jgi:hypothetical protein
MCDMALSQNNWGNVLNIFVVNTTNRNDILDRL